MEKRTKDFKTTNSSKGCKVKDNITSGKSSIKCPPHFSGIEYRDQLSSYDNSELIAKLEALKSKKGSK